MVRLFVCAVAAAFISATLVTASAQTPAPAAPAPKASKFKLTRDKLREMQAKWKANRPKLKACRAEVRKRGLAGDDRWFFIEECMDKT